LPKKTDTICTKTFNKRKIKKTYNAVNTNETITQFKYSLIVIRRADGQMDRVTTTLYPSVCFSTKLT